MNQEFKPLWISGLRSGKYTQAKNSLRIASSDDPNKMKHCCLGVATDIYCKLFSKDWFDVARKDNESYLPFEVAEFMDTSKNPVIFINESPFTLSHLNDSGYTFKQIANIIEKRL